MQQSVTLVAAAFAACCFAVTAVAVDAVVGAATAGSAIIPPPSARSCANAFVLEPRSSVRVLPLPRTGETHLKLFIPRCHPLLSSIFILTQR